MTETPSRGLERVLTAATSRVVLSRQSIATITVLVVLLHVFSSPEFGVNHLPYRISAAAVSVVPMFMVIWLAFQLPIKRPNARIAAVLTSYVVGGAVRGGTMALLLQDLSGSEGGGSSFRIPAGIVTMTFIAMTSAYDWSIYLSHRQAERELRAETAQLRSALAELELEMQADARQQAVAISGDIVRELAAIDLYPAGKQISEIQRLIDDQVRPASRESAKQLEAWRPAPQPVERTRLRDIWQAADPYASTPGIWMAWAFGFSPLATSAIWFGWLPAFRVTLFTFAGLYIGIKLIQPRMQQACAQLKPPWRGVAMTLGFQLTSVPGLVLSVLALSGTSSPYAYVIAGLIAYPIIAWADLIGQTFFNDAKIQEQKLLQVKEDLRWTIARVNLLAWFNRGLLARLLHGPIQNTLHATVIRLRDIDPEMVVDGIIGELRNRIGQAGSDYSASQSTGLEARLQEIAELWRGIAEVEADISPTAERLLSKDGPTAAIVADLCHEACSNAIRHGAANSVKIQVSTADRAIVVAVVDDGRAAADSPRPGVGTRFLDNCSTSWSYTRRPTDNRLEVSIPADTRLLPV